MKHVILPCVALALVLLGVLGSGVGTRDECAPEGFARRCGPRVGTFETCAKVDGTDYLLGIGRPHYEVTTVTCPGATPLCIDSTAGAVCRAK